MSNTEHERLEHHRALAERYDSLDIWWDAGFSEPAIVEEWSGAGFGFPEAFDWAWSFSPSQAKEWFEVGFSAEEAKAWRYFGFAVQEANSWEAAGIEDPVEAKEWSEVGFSVEEAEDWLTFHFTAQGAGEYRDEGFSAEEAEFDYQQTRW